MIKLSETHHSGQPRDISGHPRRCQLWIPASPQFLERSSSGFSQSPTMMEPSKSGSSSIFGLDKVNDKTPAACGYFFRPSRLERFLLFFVVLRRAALAVKNSFFQALPPLRRKRSSLSSPAALAVANSAANNNSPPCRPEALEKTFCSPKALAARKSCCCC